MAKTSSSATSGAPTEIIPGRLYSADDFYDLLTPRLRRVVIARLRSIDGLYLGQAIINVLANEFTVESIPREKTSRNDDIMSLLEVAEYLHVSERTVRRMVQRGQLTGEDHRAPGTHKALLRFSRAQVDIDRKKAATSCDEPPVKPKFRL